MNINVYILPINGLKDSTISKTRLGPLVAVPTSAISTNNTDRQPVREDTKKISFCSDFVQIVLTPPLNFPYKNYSFKTLT